MAASSSASDVTSKTPKTNDIRAVSRRLKSELMDLMMTEDLGISAFPEADSLFSWVGTIHGGKDTVYEGLKFKVSLQFPTDYPFKPPVVKFKTTCFHPNVDLKGNICLDILKDNWSSAYDARTILLSVQSLLGEPNVESPMNQTAAALWIDQEAFKEALHKHYKDAGGIIGK